jgi:hypothetical protein
VPHEEAVPGKTGRPSPIMLISATNLILVSKVTERLVKRQL